jgi:hypothetical protein
MLLRACLFLLVASAGPATAQDTRGAADDLVRRIRALQGADGRYGDDLATTCRVLDALGRSPRRYTDLDGPFVRKAAAQVVAGRDALADDARVVLALAGCLSPEFVEAREQALARVLATDAPVGYAGMLVFATFAPDRPAPAPSRRWRPGPHGPGAPACVAWCPQNGPACPSRRPTRPSKSYSPPWRR